MNRRRSLVVMVAALSARGIARAAEVDQRITVERGLMATRFAVTCYHADRDQAVRAIGEAYAEADRINEVASDYIADGELLSLTRHPVGEAVPVSPLLFSLLVEARFFAEKTDGLFDPTIGPLTRLWRESRRRKTLPLPEVLETARRAVGWRHLVLDHEKSTAACLVPRMRLDLGGIAKGQAADRMLAVLEKHGIRRACVTAGGDVRAGDPPPGGEGWKVGIRTTDKHRDSAELLIRNQAVSTSGDLQQFVEISGVKYSHIIDPATGLGLTRPASATIIASNGATSDALATACCVADRARGEALSAAAGAKLLS